MGRKFFARLAAFVLPVVVCAVAIPLAAEFSGAWSETRVLALPEEELSYDNPIYEDGDDQGDDPTLDPLGDPQGDPQPDPQPDPGDVLDNASDTDIKDDELKLNVETKVDLHLNLSYADCFFTPEETGFYEFAIDSGNATGDRYLYDEDSNRIGYAYGTHVSILCLLSKDKTYNLRIEAGYSEGTFATVCVSKYLPTTRGTCGDNATWSYDIATNTLVISGSGDMYDYVKYSYDDGEIPPWSFFQPYMKNVEFGSGITHISSSACFNCQSLTDVVIPDTVTSVGENAFQACNGLLTASIGSGLTVLPKNMFFECRNLTTVSISESANITVIGDQAFYMCYKLENFAIPSTVTSIGNYAFGTCESLPNQVIPSQVTSIGQWAFSFCKQFTTITIPSGMSEIAAGTFYSCNNLATISIPDSIQSIGASAFYGCQVLTSVNIPYGVTSIEDNTFNLCKSLTSIDIPSTVKSIGENAFAYCNNLSSVVIPEGVTSIALGTFSYCERLTDVTIPSTVTSIGDSAFYYCYQLSDICFPDALTFIDDYAFYYCQELSSVTLGEKMTSIGIRAFEDCGNLKTVSIASGSIGSYAFTKNQNLESVTLGDKVITIGSYAFSNCGKLKTLSLKEGLQSIGEKAFVSCKNIDGLSIPGSVRYIGKAAFNDCGNIKEVYCYADPDKLEWPRAWEGNDFIPYNSVGGPKQTKCHVFAEHLKKFEDNFSSVNVTFVGDLDPTVDLGLGATLYGYSLSLGGNIGVSFYMDIPESVLASGDAYMEFVVPKGDASETQIVSVKAVKNDPDKIVTVGEKTYYLFDCSVSAKDASSTIHAQLIDGENKSAVYSYSVKQYAEYLLAHPEVPEYSKAAPLVKALLTYCACAQKYFGTNPGNLDSTYLDSDTLYSLESIPCNTPDIELSQLPGVTFIGATLSLRSEMTLSLYFDSSKDLTFYCDKTIETTTVNGYKVVRIRGIKASELGELFEVGIGFAGEEGKLGKVKYSVLNYCSNVFDGNYDSDLQNVVKSIYLYYVEADAFAPDGGDSND